MKSKILKIYQSLPEPVRKVLSRLMNFVHLIFKPSWFNRKDFKTLPIWKKLLSLTYTFFLLVVLFILALEMNFLYLFGYMPGMKEVRNPRIPLVSEVYTVDGEKIGTFSLEKREPVVFTEIDSNTINALIATEDVRFYQHHGLDIYALFSAAFSTVKGDKRGGSTITNQLVKNVYKTRERNNIGLFGRIPLVRTIIAKIKEWITAIKIELVYSKEEILTMYLNAVEFGNNTYGIKMAARYYFSKETNELELHESALLIGLLKGPSFYNPRVHPERAISRRNTVLSQLLKYEFINDLTFAKYDQKAMKLKIQPVVKEESLAPYFQGALVRNLSSWCEEEGIDLYTDGVIIHTTLHSRMQKHATTAVQENMRYIQQAFQNGLSGHKYWYDKQIARERKELKLKEDSLTPTARRFKNILKSTTAYKSSIANNISEKQALAALYKSHPATIYAAGSIKKVNISTADSVKHMLQLLHCGLVSIEPQSGAIRAWVGGLNHDLFQYDHVDQAKRQPGSAFKPIVYAKALMTGIEPCSSLVDEPLELEVIENGEKKIWTPLNSGRSYSQRPQRLRHALAYSTNTIAVKLIEQVGAKKVVKFAEALGITSDLDPTPTLALGSSSVHLLELVQAYGVFVNEGKFTPARLVDRVENSYGEVITDFTSNIDSKRVMDEETAYTMTFMLRGTVEEPGGTAQRLLSYGIGSDNQIGGKTGTSTDYADGWFIGVTNKLVTGVWVGADDMRIHFENANGQGGRTALPIFGRYMQLVYNDPKCGVVKEEFKKPENYSVDLSCYPNNNNNPKVQKDTIVIQLDSMDIDRIEQELKEEELELEEPASEDQ